MRHLETKDIISDRGLKSLVTNQIMVAVSAREYGGLLTTGVIYGLEYGEGFEMKP